ncbi:MAG TPA: SDR family NAD(P)-dependent oxidoreductase [Candidatus Hydrogenedentes bacterium]|nr:SDR family NAD(P)-dependent oxidoreductase [Candidatus Hydrogenedentota bacterium]HRK35427.1 SDR family NAD(P)-dependent oxidoreductase [Candidatus Hydrogenedentota bacterium]
MSGISKTVLITGATGVVGKGLVKHFFTKGYRVVLTARHADTLATVAADHAGTTCHAADLADIKSLERMTEALVSAGQVPDILINNAADVTSKPFLDTSTEEIQRQIQVNVTGTLQLIRLLAPAMIAKGGGAVVNVSSLSGYKANPAQTVYSITKGAVNAMTDALRADLGLRGVHCVNIALMGVGEGPGRIPVSEVAERIERAVLRGEAEVFFYRSTKWLMRLYGAFPVLKRNR